MRMGVSTWAWALACPFVSYYLAFLSYLKHSLSNNSLQYPKNLTVTFIVVPYLLPRHISSITGLHALTSCSLEYFGVRQDAVILRSAPGCKDSKPHPMVYGTELPGVGLEGVHVPQPYRRAWTTSTFTIRTSGPSKDAFG